MQVTWRYGGCITLQVAPLRNAVLIFQYAEDVTAHINVWRSLFQRASCCKANHKIFNVGINLDVLNL